MNECIRDYDIDNDFEINLKISKDGQLSKSISNPNS